MTIEHFQNLVIGSGVAGKLLAWTLAKQGQKTVAVERSMVGGACPNVACLQKNYRERETSQAILEQGFGMQASSHGPEARGKAAGVAVRAFLDAEQYRIYQRLRVNVEVVAPSGWHVYGLSIPEGYVPLSVSVAPIEGLEAWIATEKSWPP